MTRWEQENDVASEVGAWLYAEVAALANEGGDVQAYRPTAFAIAADAFNVNGRGEWGTDTALWESIEGGAGVKLPTGERMWIDESGNIVEDRRTQDRFRVVCDHPDEPCSVYDTHDLDEPCVATCANADEADAWIQDALDAEADR